MYTAVAGSRVLVFREVGRNATTEHPLGNHTPNYTSYGGGLRGEVEAETLSIYSRSGRRVYERSMSKYSDFVGYGDRDVLIVTDSPDADSVVYDPTVVANEPPAVTEVAAVSDGAFVGIRVTTTDQSPSDLQRIEVRVRDGSDESGAGTAPGVVLERDGETGFEVYSHDLPPDVRTNVTGGSVTAVVPYDGDGPANVSVVVVDRRFDATRNGTVAFESAATPTTATDERTRSPGDDADDRSTPVPFPVGVLGTSLLVVGVALLVSRRSR